MARVPDISVTFTNHAPEVREALAEKIEQGLKAIGAQAETYAKKECPVDTGRLRNSIAWATSTDNDGGDDSRPKATPEEKTVYIGTNVEYAVYVEYNEKARHDPPEFGGGKAHFLRDAAANHGEHYKRILKNALKS